MQRQSWLRIVTPLHRRHGSVSLVRQNALGLLCAVVWLLVLAACGGNAAVPSAVPVIVAAHLDDPALLAGDAPYEMRLAMRDGAPVLYRSELRYTGPAPTARTVEEFIRRKQARAFLPMFRPEPLQHIRAELRTVEAAYARLARRKHQEVGNSAKPSSATSPGGRSWASARAKLW